MVIYDKTKGLLFIPENDDEVLDVEETYRIGYAAGFRDGQKKADEDCDNAYERGYADGYEAGQKQAAEECNNQQINI